ncbi:MAG TPA: hypothetical protein VNM66_07460, partial [Thermodesulfobacteriota bacterium]|nr:hypothetical protein [Thermodesulfobacteriota bacterium]
AGARRDPAVAPREVAPGVRRRARAPEGGRHVKSPGLAAVLSFFLPGLGQIYNGQIAKGLVLFAVGPLFFLGVLSWIVVGYFLYVPLWIYAIYDAYRSAERINAERGSVPTF